MACLLFWKPEGTSEVATTIENKGDTHEMSGGADTVAPDRHTPTWLHRFAKFTAAATAILVFMGGLVTTTGSGLSVPDWPNTYGWFMFTFPIDKMVGGIFYEHSHRLVASFVGFLTVILAAWLWLKEPRAWVKKLGVLALAAVIIQGVLGGITVLFLLPTPVSLGHALLAQSFFCLVVSIAVITGPGWNTTLREEAARQSIEGAPVGTPFKTLATATTAVVYIQLFLGALMRHTGSGFVVPDFPLAWGHIFPPLTEEALTRFNTKLIHLDMRTAADPTLTEGQILSHLAHRLGAVLVVISTLWTAIRAAKRHRQHGQIFRPSALLGALALVQFSLGALTVLTLGALLITTLHVLVGAITLATSVVLLLRVYRLTWSNAAG